MSVYDRVDKVKGRPPQRPFCAARVARKRERLLDLADSALRDLRQAAQDGDRYIADHASLVLIESVLKASDLVSRRGVRS
jgi:hypothetical protein